MRDRLIGVIEVEARRLEMLRRQKSRSDPGDHGGCGFRRIHPHARRWKAWYYPGTARSLHHPKQGLLQFDYSSFQANDDPALKLVIYTPV
jgi:hypothetical protein